MGYKKTRRVYRREKARRDAKPYWIRKLEREEERGTLRKQ